jgi:hypothetical protein
VCGLEFRPTRFDGVLCSSACKQRLYRGRKGETEGQYLGMPHDLFKIAR